MVGEIEHVEVPKTFTLEFPFDFGKGENAEEVTELTIKRRLNAGDLTDITAGIAMPIGDMLKLISRLCEWPLIKVKKLDAFDMMAVTEVINSFLGSGQTDG